RFARAQVAAFDDAERRDRVATPRTAVDRRDGSRETTTRDHHGHLTSLGVLDATHERGIDVARAGAFDDDAERASLEIPVDQPEVGVAVRRDDRDGTVHDVLVVERRRVPTFRTAVELDGTIVDATDCTMSW